MKILLVSNPGHIGIRAVAEGYQRAFQSLGVELEFINFQDRPAISHDEANCYLQWLIPDLSFDHCIFIQPSYFSSVTYSKLKRLNKNFYCINTDDPYSSGAIFPIHNLFKIKFTNEIAIQQKYSYLGYEYLPLAFDSLQPYSRSDVKDIDVSIVVSFYGNRVRYLSELKWLNKDLKVFIAGSMAPLLKETNTIFDLTGFSAQEGLLKRHKELEVYSRSKIVLNPHRSPMEVGKSYLNLINEGVPCLSMIDVAYSPNPRYFDAIANGAICMNDLDRTECDHILEKYGIDFNTSYCLPDNNMDFVDTIDLAFNIHSKNNEKIKELSKRFREQETYVQRARIVLERLSR